MVNRFDIFLINLDAEAREDAKNTRPAVIISPDEMNRNLKHVIIAPLSSTEARFPTRIAVEFLGSERFIILDHIRSVDKIRLVKKIGEIDGGAAQAVLGMLGEMFAD